VFREDFLPEVETWKDKVPSLLRNRLRLLPMSRNQAIEATQLAGVEVLESRISYLAYAPEIAAAMLQRQQAGAIIAARRLIVEAAVGMVEHALQMLAEKNIIDLDPERKAAMVSNLLVVLCGEHDASPVVNAGTIHQ
jgi:hypothetical protein